MASRPVAKHVHAQRVRDRVGHNGSFALFGSRAFDAFSAPFAFFESSSAWLQILFYSTSLASCCHVHLDVLPVRPLDPPPSLSARPSPGSPPHRNRSAPTLCTRVYAHCSSRRKAWHHSLITIHAVLVDVLRRFVATYAFDVRFLGVTRLLLLPHEIWSNL
jgi:hypothetical protein